MLLIILAAYLTTRVCKDIVIIPKKQAYVRFFAFSYESLTV